LAAMVQPSGMLGSEAEMVSEAGSLGIRNQGAMHLGCSQGTDFNSLGAILQQNRELQTENANLRGEGGGREEWGRGKAREGGRMWVGRGTSEWRERRGCLGE